MLIDGVRYGSTTAGTAALEHIPVAQVARIEILRGPAGSLYGADAVGGVIQVFTRQGKGTARPQVQLQVAGGNLGQKQASAQLSGAQDGTQARTIVQAIRRQCLHARALRLIHPDGRELRFESPWPSDFQAAVQAAFPGGVADPQGLSLPGP